MPFALSLAQLGKKTFFFYANCLARIGYGGGSPGEKWRYFSLWYGRSFAGAVYQTTNLGAVGHCLAAVYTNHQRGGYSAEILSGRKDSIEMITKCSCLKSYTFYSPK